MKMPTKIPKEIPVVVTTERRLVAFGYADPKVIEKKSFWLARARCCLYWPKSTSGFMGLADRGPSADARVGSRSPMILLHDITSVQQCTPEAVAAWEAASCFGR
jgi:hypothetical protein